MKNFPVMVKMKLKPLGSFKEISKFFGNNNDLNYQEIVSQV